MCESVWCVCVSECGVCECMCVVCVVCVSECRVWYACMWCVCVCVIHFQAPTKHSIAYNKFARSVRPSGRPYDATSGPLTKGIFHEAGCLGRYVAAPVNPVAYLRPFRGTWASWALSYLVSYSIVFSAR